MARLSWACRLWILSNKWSDGPWGHRYRDYPPGVHCAGADAAGFPLAVLRQSFADAEADGFMGTDEASIVERSGVQVAVVMGSPANLKITHPGDLQLAEFYLQHRA